MIVLTRASPTESRLVRKLLHTIHYAAYQKHAKCSQQRYRAEDRSEPSFFLLWQYSITMSDSVRVCLMELFHTAAQPLQFYGVFQFMLSDNASTSYVTVHSVSETIH